MTEIFTAFGIDGKLIIIQIFNFALLLAALWYFLYTPVLKILNERQQKIAKGVEDSEAAEKKLAEAGEEKQTILATAHNEADEIVERAKKHADEKGQEMVSEAQTKSERILEDAKDKGEDLKRRMEKESQEDITKIAILAAEKVLKQKHE